jgi:hypothetical protein
MTTRPQDYPAKSAFEVLRCIGAGTVDVLTLQRMNEIMGSPIDDEGRDLNETDTEYFGRLCCEAGSEHEIMETFRAACEIE